MNITKKTNITDNAKKLLVALAELTAVQGYPPTYRELGLRLGINVSSTFARIEQMRRLGLITAMEETTRARGLRLTEEGFRQLGQPAIPLSALPLVQHLPVFHSSEAVIRYLETPGVREIVSSAQALANHDVRIIPIAEMRPSENARR